MDLNIKIVKLYQGELPIRIERITQNLIKHIPNRYLLGIDSILLVNRVSQRNLKNAGGIYVPPKKNEHARIEIAIDVIYKGVPKFIFYFPFITRFLLASVMYHEIGHHQQLSIPNLKKKLWEIHAEKFANKMLKKVFWPWMIIFIPFYLLNRVVKVLKKHE